MAEPQRPTEFAELLRLLVVNEVDFVVVGGTAAVLAGVWHATDDVDVVVDYVRTNLERLAHALEQVDAHYLDPAGRTIRPDVPRLESFRLNLLITRLGRLDVLRSIGRDRSYPDLLERSKEVALGTFSVRSVDVATLIEAKEVANRPKDRSHLLLLREFQKLSAAKESADGPGRP